MTIAIRESTYVVAAVATDSTSEDINISSYAWGEVAIPTGSSLTTLTYYTKAGGAYYAAYDSAGAAITQTVAADRSYPLPAGIFGAHEIQVRGNTAGTIRVTLKS